MDTAPAIIYNSYGDTAHRTMEPAWKDKFQNKDTASQGTIAKELK